MSASRQLGSRPMVFFTGGSALRELSRVLAERACPTAHLVTTFDAGGSSARLREAFGMPAVGDLRNRLTALAAPQACGPDLLRCMRERLPEQGDPAALRAHLHELADREHEFWGGVPTLAARSLRRFLRAFLADMPRDFDARKASLGNLFMAGAYLLERRSLASTLSIFSRLLHARGQVLPPLEESLHLAARLEDGSCVVGQDGFRALKSPVRELFLTVHEPGRGVASPTPCRPRAQAATLARLREAGLVCYPMGSFHSSVLAGLLAEGVGRSVAALPCPKVFIPNTGLDPELMGLPLQGQVERLVGTLARDLPGAAPRHFLSHVLVDPERGRYKGDLKELEDFLSPLGVALSRAPVVREDGESHDAAATAAWLMALRAGAVQGDA